MPPARSRPARCSPSAQMTASARLLLPEPFGPTTTLMPGPISRVVASANDLNPRRVRRVSTRRLRRPRGSRASASTAAARSDACLEEPEPVPEHLAAHAHQAGEGPPLRAARRCRRARRRPASLLAGGALLERRLGVALAGDGGVERGAEGLEHRLADAARRRGRASRRRSPPRRGRRAPWCGRRARRAASRRPAGAAATKASGRPPASAAAAQESRSTTAWRIQERSPSATSGWRRMSSSLTTTSRTLSPRNSSRS